MPFRPFVTSASAADRSGPGPGKSLHGFSGDVLPCTCTYRSGDGQTDSGHTEGIFLTSSCLVFYLRTFDQAILGVNQKGTFGALLLRSATAGLGALSVDPFSGSGASAACSAAAAFWAALSVCLNSIAFLLLGLAADLAVSLLSPKARQPNFCMRFAAC